MSEQYLEIERKFRLRDERWRHAVDGLEAQRLVQGYLSRDPQRSVRVRLAGDTAWLTVKGMSERASRLEFEYPIPAADAEAMLALCEGPLIDKQRYRLPIDNDTRYWEIDEFFGDNAGLVVAELELRSENETVPQPSWLGEEVTGDPNYYNSNLSQRPFAYWTEEERR